MNSVAVDGGGGATYSFQKIKNILQANLPN